MVQSLAAFPVNDVTTSQQKARALGDLTSWTAEVMEESQRTAVGAYKELSGFLKDQLRDNMASHNLTEIAVIEETARWASCGLQALLVTKAGISCSSANLGFASGAPS